jgi:hypothetical protein
VTTDKPGLFAAPPTIDASGDLSYTPAPNVSGTADVTVTLDDGDPTTTDDSETFNIDVSKPHPFYNAANPLDVNNDKVIAPNDALKVINCINAHINGAAGESSGVPLTPEDIGFCDVNKDGFIEPNDALMVINVINAHQATAGEGAPGPEATDAALLSLMAQDTADATQGKRRT